MRKALAVLAVLVLAQLSCSVYWGGKRVVDEREALAVLASPAPLPPHGIRSEVLADVVRVRDGFLTPLEEYYHKGEMVTVYRREGNWCWVGENRQIFCGCLSGFNAGLGCEAR